MAEPGRVFSPFRQRKQPTTARFDIRNRERGAAKGVQQQGEGSCKSKACLPVA